MIYRMRRFIRHMVELSTAALLMLANPSYAELRDPTRPDFPEASTAAAIPTESQTPPKAAPLQLSEIWISPHSKRAVINGVRVKLGDMLANGMRVQEIEYNQVALKDNSGIKILQLHQRSYQTSQ